MNNSRTKNMEFENLRRLQNLPVKKSKINTTGLFKLNNDFKNRSSVTQQLVTKTLDQKSTDNNAFDPNKNHQILKKIIFINHTNILYFYKFRQTLFIDRNRICNSIAFFTVPKFGIVSPFGCKRCKLS